MSFRPPHPTELLIHFLQIETFGPEGIPGRRPEIVELLVIWLEDNFEKLFVSRDTALGATDEWASPENRFGANANRVWRNAAYSPVWAWHCWERWCC